VSIDWGSFLLVAVASLVSTAVVVSLYSLGVRFLALTRLDEASGERLRPRYASVLAVVCFGISACAVLYGVYLIVPYFHR
jgi:hypothetical protein